MDEVARIKKLKAAEKQPEPDYIPERPGGLSFGCMMLLTILISALLSTIVFIIIPLLTR